MARALLKKEEDDQVDVKTPEGIRVWYINRISYVEENQEEWDDVTIHVVCCFIST